MWFCGAALLPLVLAARGAPLGVPTADDYDFLHRARFGPAAWLDGGGAIVYWRPLARQVYYGAAETLMLSAPIWLAVVHLAMIAASILLLYRAFRPAWGGARAALAATFPLWAEGTRTLVAWPAAFQDLGAFAFSALALHARTRRRTVLGAGALLAALLCKEIAIVTAILLPWMPGSPSGRGERRRWGFVAAGVTLAWGFTYLAVLRSGAVVFQGDLESGRAPYAQRLLWSLYQSVGDALSVDGRGPSADPVLAAITGGVVLALAACAWRVRSDRARGAAAVWGLALFVASAVLLAETHPVWGSFRSTLGLFGLGVAVTALIPDLRALAVLATIRIGALLLAPLAPSGIPPTPPALHAGLEFEALVRLQHYAGATRATLRAGNPHMPRGGLVGRHHRPLMADQALAGDRALQVWYQDTTLRWIDWKDIDDRPGLLLTAAVEYEPYAARQVARVTPVAMAAYVQGIHQMQDAAFDAALERLDRAEAVQVDSGAVGFLGAVAGKKALCRLGLEDPDAARREARRSLELWRDGGDARYVLAVLLELEGDRRGAIALLDSTLARFPYDVSARQLRDSLARP